MKHLDTIISRVTFANNGIHDEQFKDILEGLRQLTGLKSIIYKQNEFGVKALNSIIPIITRSFPSHLEELRIVNCKISSSTTE